MRVTEALAAARRAAGDELDPEALGALLDVVARHADDRFDDIEEKVDAVNDNVSRMNRRLLGVAISMFLLVVAAAINGVAIIATNFF